MQHQFLYIQYIFQPVLTLCALIIL